VGTWKTETRRWITNQIIESIQWIDWKAQGSVQCMAWHGARLTKGCVLSVVDHTQRFLQICIK
jgi:hypothetical protein